MIMIKQFFILPFFLFNYTYATELSDDEIVKRIISESIMSCRATVLVLTIEQVMAADAAKEVHIQGQVVTTQFVLLEM